MNQATRLVIRVVRYPTRCWRWRNGRGIYLKDIDTHEGHSMLTYPARVRRDGNRFLVLFPDIPEALTDGATRDEALANAADALATAMEFYFEDSRSVPLASPLKRGQVAVALPASLSAKVLLLNAMIEDGVSASELARRLSTTKQEANRIVDLGHTTKIDTIAQALLALGRRLRLRTEQVAVTP